MAQFRLKVPEHTNFSHFLTRIGQSSHQAFFRIKDGRIGSIFEAGYAPCFVEIEEAPQAGYWQVFVRVGSADEGVLAEILRRTFSLDHDLSAFYSHCRHDIRMQALVQKFAGARMLRDTGVFSSIISTVISQQINLKFAAVLKKRLWALAGEAVEYEDQVFYADPRPAAIASLRTEQLRELQYSQSKAEYIIDIARKVIMGQFALDELARLKDDEAIGYMCKQRGLGAWSAECILMFGLGRTDLLPAKDVGLQKAVTRLWQLEQRASEQDIRRLGEQWRPWRSLYTYYLWLSLMCSSSELAGAATTLVPRDVVV